MIRQSIDWYLSYATSYCEIEEIMQERGYDINHSTIQRWVVHFAPQLKQAFRKNKTGDLSVAELDLGPVSADCEIGEGSLAADRQPSPAAHVDRNAR